MKRRSFLRNIGLGTTGVITASSTIMNNDAKRLPPFNYGEAKSLSELLNEDGEAALRFEILPNNSPKSNAKGAIKVKNADISRAKTYFVPNTFPNEEIPGNAYSFNHQLIESSPVIIVVWLKNVGEKTSMQLSINNEKLQFSLAELINKKDYTLSGNDFNCMVNYLMHKEIGSIDINKIVKEPQGEDFSFIAIADPQGGNAFFDDEPNTRMRIHNAFIEETVALVNRMQLQPAFTIVVGDVTDGWGTEQDFIMMNHYLMKLKTPLLYEIGNHETELKLNFHPGYNMDGFKNYLAAQKQINNTEKLLYSFDMGQWHFIVWPDPLRHNFWENHPHYFDWLEKDLEKNKNKPTFIFQHVPTHPIGIQPLIDYCEDPWVKRTFLAISSKHQNVKYILSGHVHIPVKASFKTAVNYKGMKMINLPAAGYRPRAFGEQDFHNGPAQGALIIDVKGKDAKLTFKTVTEEEFVYPDEFPDLNTDKHTLWLHNVNELPPNNSLMNGNFQNGFDAWGCRYAYIEDVDPSNVARVDNINTPVGQHALYLFNKCRAYGVPGQDRYPQSVNRYFQAVKASPSKQNGFEFYYRIDPKTDFNGLNGGYIWVEGFRDNLKTMHLVYAINHYWYNIDTKTHLNKFVKPIILGLDGSNPGEWLKVQANWYADYLKNEDGKILPADLLPDKVILSAGVWNINDGQPQPFGMHVTGFKILSTTDDKSMVGGKQIMRKDLSKIYWRGKNIPNNNIAGEHRYYLGTEINYPIK